MEYIALFKINHNAGICVKIMPSESANFYTYNTIMILLLGVCCFPSSMHYRIFSVRKDKVFCELELNFLYTEAEYNVSMMVDEIRVQEGVGTVEVCAILTSSSDLTFPLPSTVSVTIRTVNGVSCMLILKHFSLSGFKRVKYLVLLFIFSIR